MGGDLTTKLIDLPTELIEHIFDFLPLYQRATLLQVCRTLSRPCYWQNTYHTVSLYDTQQLHNFVNTIDLSPNGFSEVYLGKYVRYLTLWENLLETNNDAVEFLQQQCPDVECIELTTGPDTKHPRSCNISSNGWSKLTVIHSSLFDEWKESIPDYEQQLKHLVMYKAIDFGQTCSFPLLTHLDYRGHLHVHSLDEMNQINRVCPMLRCLHMGNLDVSYDYDDVIKTTGSLATGTHLTHLSLGNVYFSDPAMYQVFGALFPNLGSLKIQHLAAKTNFPIVPDVFGGTWRGTDSDNDDSDIELQHNRVSLQQHEQVGNQLLNRQHHHTWPSIVQSLDQMMSALPYLRQLSLPSIGIYPYSEEWSPVNLWVERCAQLKDIRLDWYCKNFKTYEGLTDKRPELKWERVLHLLDLCQDTIQAWHLFLKQDPVSTQRTVFEKLVQCSRLHSLTIHTTYESDTTLPIDELLNSLPHLKSLEFRTKFGKDLLSPIEKQAPRLRSLAGSTILPHGLTRFIYIGKLHSSRLVAYVHARCPKLSVLHLDGRQTPSKKTITLDLPGWRLRELDIGSEFRVGKMVKTVLVQERSYSPPRSRWFQFSRGAWYRQRQVKKCQSLNVPGSANLTILCDFVERCVFKPQDPCFINTP